MLSRLKGIETLRPSIMSNTLCRAYMLSRLKGIETIVPREIQKAGDTSAYMLSRLKGIETSARQHRQ